MRPKFFNIALLFVLCVSVAVSLNAQTDRSATGQATSAPPEEHKVGDYVAAGSFEVGYRFVDVNGAHYPCLRSNGTTGICNYTGMWNTFENLDQGPRVFDQSLSLRSIGETGVLFDNLYVSSYGWGGDPENVARLRINRHKMYDFTALFRRDYSRFDFNVLANPLNPIASTPSIQIPNSPHLYDTVRRMTDLNLTLAPTSPISVRLGYNRVRVEGPNFTTFHMPRGTDINPGQFMNYTNDGFRAGVDIKLLPRTTLSFDGVVNWYKNDTLANNKNFFWAIPTPAGGTVPADLGISWNTFPSPPPSPNQPCAAAAVGTAACNLDFSFLRQDRYRSTSPNVLGAIESHYFRRLDISLRGSYGWSDLDSRFFQNWTGWVTGGRFISEQITNDPVTNKRISTSADLGTTFHITDHIRFLNSLRYVNQQMPLFGINIDTTAGGTNALTPTGVTTTTATGIVNGLFIKTLMDEPILDFDLGRHAGFHFGYRFTRYIYNITGEAGFDVDVNTGERISPIEPGEFGFDRFKIPKHTGLGGVWFQPSDKVRINADAEFSSAGITYITPSDTGTGVDTFTGLTTFTRVTPRHEQQYRARATVKPTPHVSLTGSANIIEQRNNLDIQYRMHNRNFGFNADISPNDRVLVDLGYNFQDYLQSNFICYVYGNAGAIPAGTFPGITNLAPCPQSGDVTAVTSYYGTNGRYANQVHFGDLMVRVKPVKRATLSLGYSIVSTDGSAPITYAFIPLTAIRYNYHRPLAALEIELAKGFALKGGWNYYGYNEKGSTAASPFSGGPTTPRDFHTNTGQVSLRYSF